MPSCRQGFRDRNMLKVIIPDLKLKSGTLGQSFKKILSLKKKSRFGDPCKSRSDTIVLYLNRKGDSESSMVCNQENKKAFLPGFLTVGSLGHGSTKMSGAQMLYIG